MRPVAFILMLTFLAGSCASAGGIAPEQIYQQSVDWQSLIGTWEVLSDDSPLVEKDKTAARPVQRTLMTLRKDGTCRVFNQTHPLGTDGLWTFEGHEMFITFRDAPSEDYFVYGVKGGFMVTHSPIKGGKDKLWSKVK